MWALGFKPRFPSLYNKCLYLLIRLARSSLFSVPLLSLALVFLWFCFIVLRQSLYIALAAIELAMKTTLAWNSQSHLSLKVSATTPSWLPIFNFFHQVTSVIIIVYVWGLHL